MKLFDMSNTNLSQDVTGLNNAKKVDTGPTMDGNSYHEQSTLKSELTDEKIQEAEFEQMNNSMGNSYTNMLESLHLPFISSSTSKSSLPCGGESGKRKEGSKITSEEGSTSDWQYMLPNIIRNDSSSTKDSLHREAVQFMRGIMDEATHLRNYDVPYDPSLIIIVAAELDAYQPRDGITALTDIWPGSEIRYIKGEGHVASYLFRQDVFRQAIYDAIDKLSEKYPSKLEL